MDQTAPVNRGTKTLVALTIVAWGVAAAFVFQRAAPTRDSPDASSPERLVSRGEAAWQTNEPAAPPLPKVRLQTRAARSPQPALVAGPAVALNAMDSGMPPPKLARSFPETNETFGARWGAMLGLAPPSRGQPARTHRVIDGDTLKALARRYLGSPDRFMEIYATNRDVLPNPEVLPIGAELKIPPRQQEPPPALTPAGPMVPVLPRDRDGTP